MTKMDTSIRYERALITVHHARVRKRSASPRRKRRKRKDARGRTHGKQYCESRLSRVRVCAVHNRRVQPVAHRAEPRSVLPFDCLCGASVLGTREFVTDDCGASVSRRGQVTPQVMLIAAACAGVWYGGYYTVKGVKAVGHLIAKPFHHHDLPLTHKKADSKKGN